MARMIALAWAITMASCSQSLCFVFFCCFGFRFGFGENKGRRPKGQLFRARRFSLGITSIIRRSIFEKRILRSNPQGSLLTRFQVFVITKGDGADEPPTQMEPCPRGGMLLEGKLCFYGLFFTQLRYARSRRLFVCLWVGVRDIVVLVGRGVRCV